MLKKIKLNKYFLLSLILTLLLIIVSFFQFFNEIFSYAKDYYKIKEYCYEEKNPEHEYCKIFKEKEHLNRYIEVSDPTMNFKNYDAITMTCTIVENTLFSTLQYFSPLIIILATLGVIHSQFSSGMFENFFLRQNYKKYLRQTYKTVLKVSLIMPLALILIFIISTFISGFNFDFSNIDTGLAVYNKWKYENFFVYGVIICLIQFFISLLYANISLLCCKKNKNKLVAIIMSYVMFIVVDIILYIVIYAIILNKILGIKEMTDYFNIAGYWFFTDGSKCFVPLIISFILFIGSFIILKYSFKSKEQVILSYEKHVS